jgi:uncharacterized protein DUF4166
MGPLDHALASETPKGLYPRLLGPSWCELPAQVRSLFLTGQDDALRARGAVVLRWGACIAARCIAWILRLPRPCDAVQLRLETTRHDVGERWARTFGTTPLVTQQQGLDGGELVESYGLAELVFQVRVVRQTLEFVLERAALTLGPLSLPMCGLRITARVKASGRGEGAHLHVATYAPLVGLLLEYEGDVEREEAQA